MKNFKLNLKIGVSLLLFFTMTNLFAQDSSTISKQVKNQKSFAAVGYTTLNYVASGGQAGFTSATYNPIFVYKVNDKLSFNSELEVEVADVGVWDGAVALEFAEFNYQINDNLAIYGGKFLSPLGTYQARLHPAWVNKSINNPIGIQNEVNGIKRLQGDSELGIGIRGGFYSGDARFNYDLYTTNGPGINDDGSVDFENAGGDINASPAIGGRIGFLPFPNSTFELGLSAYSGRASLNGAAKDINVNLFVFDLNYVKHTDAGNFDIKGQYNSQKVTDATYSGTKVPFQSFNNKTSAYYLQFAYRLPDSKIELVNRISNFNVPNEVTWGADQTRYTIGIDYWVGWNSAFKFGYDIINNDANAFGFTFVMGL